MKLIIKNSFKINKEKIENLVGSKLRRFNHEIKIIDNSILFQAHIKDGGEYLVAFKDGDIKTIDLSPFRNNHKLKYQTVKDKFGNPKRVPIEPNFPDLVDYSSTDIIFFVHQNKFGLVNLFNLYLWEDLDSDPIHFSITKGLKTKKVTNIKGWIYFTDLNLLKVGRSTIENQIPVVFSDYGHRSSPQYFTVLEINNENKTAYWKFTENKMPISLDLDEYPLEKWYKDRGLKPFVSDIFWNGNNFRTFTWGCTNSIASFGYDCKVLLEANTLGKRNKIILQPEKIALAKFPSNPNYVIMEPFFNKDGKPYIYNANTNESIFPKLPRGYSKYEIFEITDNAIWLKQEDAEKIEIIECEM